MLHVITVILTFLPTLVLITFFYRRDINREPRKTLTITLLYGGLSFVPVVIIENYLSNLGLMNNQSPLLYNLYDMIVNVAVPEETFKLLVILLYSARSSAFDEPMDGLVYGVAAALGFATVENIFYVIEGGLGTAITRAILSVPSHAFWGAILGYSVGQVRFKKRKPGFVISGLLIAILLHGLFNYFLITIETAGAYTDALSGFMILGLLFLLFTVFALEMVWILRTIRRLRTGQQQKDSQEKGRLCP